MKGFLSVLMVIAVLISGCSEGSKVTDNDLVPDKDEVSDEVEIDDHDVDEIPDDSGSGTSDIINNGLDESFFEPSRGFVFKMVAPLLPSAPTSYELKDEEKPFFLKGELTDNSGNVFTFSNIDGAFGANYEGYLYITAASEYIEQTYYSVMLLPALETLDWMVENGTDTINSSFFYLYAYRNDFIDNKLFRMCPDAIPDMGRDNLLKVYIEDGRWKIDETFGLMVNSHLTFDKKAVTAFFGNELHKLCYCYEVSGGNFIQRDCTIEDMDLDPLPPSNPMPLDGAENIDIDTGVSWSEGSDPAGGEVTYTLYFGIDNPPIKQAFENSKEISWKPPKSLEKNTRYFWKVVATNEKGNKTEGDIWTFNTDEEEVSLPEHNFLIVVNENLKGKIDDALNLYVTDIENEGYSPAVRYWHPGGAKYLKHIIKKSYEQHNIMGALLVGDLPPALFEMESDFGDEIGVMYEFFPSEYYFMDMDGVWEDSDGNGIYDKYPKNLTLEIFTSRIMGTAKEISDYFERTSDYRNNGSFFEPRNFFSFIDNDWIIYDDGQGNVWEDPMGAKNKKWELESIYGDNYERREEVETTSKTEYMGFMTQSGAEYVYQWIHSNPQNLYFDDNFSPNPNNILNINELIEGNVKGSFYNLFDCSIARYIEKEGNIASEYVKGEYGLAILGSTKVGGVFNPEVMNIALANGYSWGAGYQMWVNDIWENHASYGFDKNFIESWWLGMMIQGDPLLTLTDKKTFVTRSLFPKKFYPPEFIEWINSTLR